MINSHSCRWKKEQLAIDTPYYTLPQLGVLLVAQGGDGVEAGGAGGGVEAGEDANEGGKDEGTNGQPGRSDG
jgi:hypothetical protein